MSDALFECSYGGDAAKIDATARLECKICWHIYDPAVGCDYWQIPPGTPFSALPEHWSCPNCDGRREDFMVVEGD
ncbi:MAG: rubredoxin [Hyphomicrobiaceae bacterium]|nr:rubredoxin [Hyphomicrobiaceae bacterium]